MTSAAAAGGAPGRIRAWLIWLSHFEPQILAGFTVVAALGALLPESWVLSIATGVAIGTMFAAKLGDMEHMRMGLCDTCAARFPLNAPEIAQRRRKTLQRHHSRVLAIAVLLPMVLIIIGAPLSVRLIFGLEATRTWSSWLLVPMWPILAYFAWERHVHRQLQPWCPWCRRRDEDDDPIVVPEPTPPSARIDA